MKIVRILEELRAERQQIEEAIAVIGPVKQRLTE